MAKRWISALQIATIAWLDGLGVVAAALVVLDVVEVAAADLLLVVELLLVVVLLVVVLVGVLLLLLVVEVLLVVFAVLVELGVLDVDDVLELPPQAATSTPLTTAPISSRYSLRVID